MSFKKSAHNTCPVCGLPRGKGKHEFAHGKCAEVRAKTDGRESARLPGKLSSLTADQVEQGRRNEVKKKYMAGKLPDWMFS